jgi:ACS family pantothenate transporter-like MFS transporter
MIGGYIQTGIYATLNNRNGLSGWRWLFIIDGLITIPIAIYGFVFFPDTPQTTEAFYLTDAERALAVARVPAVEKSSPLSWGFFKRIVSSWYWWGFVGLWIIAGETESFSTNAALSLYMKSHPVNKYDVTQLNNYPTGVAAVGIVSTLFWATLTDLLNGKRYLVGYFIGITGIATSAMILGASKHPTSPASTSVVFGAYYWAGTVYACQATFFAWCNDALRYESHMFRAVVLAGMNLGSNAVNAWWSIVFYGASMAPWFIVSLSREDHLHSETLWQALTESSPARHVGYDCMLNYVSHLDRRIVVLDATGRQEAKSRASGSNSRRCQGQLWRSVVDRVRNSILHADVRTRRSGRRIGSGFSRPYDT